MEGRAESTLSKDSLANNNGIARVDGDNAISPAWLFVLHRSRRIVFVGLAIANLNGIQIQFPRGLEALVLNFIQLEVFLRLEHFERLSG
jgi:hypothetical protein